MHCYMAKDSHNHSDLANNTPQAVLRSFYQHEEEREAAHWESKGKQIVSTRATCPTVSFHNGPSGRVVEEKARCRELGEHPCLRNPGPEAYTVLCPPVACAVPAGWLKEPRFKNSPFEGERKVDNPTKLLKFSTECHPLAATYPYPEPVNKAALPEGESPEPVATQDSRSGTSNLATSQPSRPADEPADRRNPIRTADLNCQYFKFSTHPNHAFGSSGLGFRFMPGTQFARQPAQRQKPHSRLRGFRELREEIPEMSEKVYQDALEKAMAEATAAAAKAQALSQKAIAAPTQAETSAARKQAANSAAISNADAAGLQQSSSTAAILDAGPDSES